MNLRIWDLRFKKCESLLKQIHNQGILQTEFLLPNIFFTHGRDSHIRIWDIQNLKQPTQTISPQAPSTQFSFCKAKSWKNQFLAIPSSTEQTEIDIFDIASNKYVIKLSPNKDRPYGMLMSLCFFEHNNVYLMAGYENGSIIIWNMQQPNAPWFVRHSSKVTNDSAILSTAVHSLGERWIIGTVGQQITVVDSVWEAEQISSVKTIIEYELPMGGISDISIRSSDERIFATAGWDHRVRIYDLKRGKPLTILKYHTEAVHSVAFNYAQSSEKANSNSNIQDYALLASASKDGRIAIWNPVFEKKK